MSKIPGTLIILVITWTVFLVARIGLIWQAIMDKSLPVKSKSSRIVNEIKFRHVDETNRFHWRSPGGHPQSHVGTDPLAGRIC